MEWAARRLRGDSLCGTSIGLEIAAALGLEVADFFFHPNGRPTTTSQVVAAYAYRDDRGELFYEVVRYADKSFRQRRPMVVHRDLLRQMGTGLVGHWTLPSIR